MRTRLLIWAAMAVVLAGIEAAAAGLIAVEPIGKGEGNGGGTPELAFPPRMLPPIWTNANPTIPRTHCLAALELRSHQAQVTIKDQSALVRVEEEFYNPNPARLEGTFLFPVPRGAQLKKFSMEIGGKDVEAELLGADKASQVYEEIVRKMRDPALLEYAGRDLIRVRIFPIEPREHKRVRLSYTQLLRADSGLVEFRYPLSTAKFSPKPVESMSLKIDLETRRPLKTIYSPTPGIEMKRHGENRAVVGYEAKQANPAADLQLFFAQEGSEVGMNLMTYQAGEEPGYFLLLATPGFSDKTSGVIPKDVAFVLDTSGSMAGKKLEQGKKALEFCLENLNPEDRFEVARFSTEVEPLFNRLVDATAANRAKAEGFVRHLKPMGGTAIDDALKKALSLRSEGSDRPYIVVFLTDGLPTVGVTQEERILASVAERAGKTRIFCFGIGHDVNTHLLDGIAEKTRSVSQYVVPEEDIEVKVSSFFTKIKEPVLTNLKLKFPESIHVSQIYPGSLPDLFQGEQLVVAGRYSGQGSGAITIEGTANGKVRTFAEDASFTGSATEHDFIPRLWAARRVGYLLDEIRLHGENKELKDEVTQLAREYGIVTPYTAYLIVEDEKQRAVPLTSQSLPRLQMDSSARSAAGAAMQDFYQQRSGGAAVAASRYGSALKTAVAPEAAISSGNAEAARALLFSAPGAVTGPSRVKVSGGAGGGQIGGGVPVQELSAADRLSQSGQQCQYVRGRAFYQNGNQWIDARVQNGLSLPRVRIEFNSKEYFALIASEPAVRGWLALGPNVQFSFRNQIYEISEAGMGGRE